MSLKRLPEFDSLNDLSIILFLIFGEKELSLRELNLLFRLSDYAHLKVNPKNIKRELKLLFKLGLVKQQKRNEQVFYSLTKKGHQAKFFYFSGCRIEEENDNYEEPDFKSSKEGFNFKGGIGGVS